MVLITDNSKKVAAKCRKQLDIYEGMLILTPAEQLRNELKKLRKCFKLTLVK